MKLLYVLLFATKCSWAVAQTQAVTIDDSTTTVNIVKQTWVMEDEYGLMTIDSVVKSASKFVAHEGETFFFPSATSVYWLKFLVRFHTSKDFVVFVDEAKLEVADLYFQDAPNGPWKTIRNGFSVPFSEKAIAHNYQVFPLNQTAASTGVTAFYLRVKPNGVPISMTIALKKYFFEELESIHRFLYGLLLGVIVFVAFNNLAWYLTTRIKLRLLYFIVTINFVIYLVIFDGYVGFFSPSLYRSLLRVLTPLTYLGQAAVVYYGTQFLEIKKYNVYLYRWCLLVTGLLVIGVLLSIVLRSEPIHWFITSFGFFGITVLATCLALGIFTSIYNRTILRKTALIYTLSYGLFFIAFLFEAAHLKLGWPYLFFVRYLNIGFLCETIGLAIALSVYAGIEKRTLEEARNRAQNENLRLARKHNEELEERVRQRTFELLEKTKMAQQLMAEYKGQSEQLRELNDLKNKFFSIVSHDLRSPLTQLHASLDFAKQGVIKPEEFRWMIDSIRTNLSRNIELTDNLIAWAGTQLNGAQMVIADFNLHDLIERKRAFFEVSAKQKNITILNLVPPDVEITSDRNIVGLIVHNLIANAIKFSNSGDEISVHVQCTAKQFEVSVVDTGIGMSPEDVKKIQSNNAFTTEGTARERGSGLGLMICKDLIHQIGGRFSVESKLGEGSVFRFTVPSKSLVGVSP